MNHENVKIFDLISYFVVIYYMIRCNIVASFFKEHSQNCEKRQLASLCHCIRMSDRMEQLCSHWEHFHKI